MTPEAVLVLPVDGLGEVAAADDLAALLVAALGPSGLEDGDVLVVTSKVVSKAEGRHSDVPKDAVVTAETDRVLATRGDTRIVRTRHGLVLAGAGVDASNTAAGTTLALPVDPDASAVRLREALHATTGRNVAVVVSDTAGRAWREGQTDIAIGAAGLQVLDDHAGRDDGYGNVLAVTAPAVADEIAAAGDLVKGKLSRRPAAVVRGLAARVLPPGEHGPGARALVRAESRDMFGLGAREAVLAAVTEDAGSVRGFGVPATAHVVAQHLGALDRVDVRVTDGAPTTVDVLLPSADERARGRLEARLTAAAFALGWRARSGTDPDRLSFVETTQ
jgi:coenzyme F420-0:L-glutamate ligase/coenzyme F420-1:gamma-L-glutamate ligase